jgi:Flp pilus assembly protein TadG
VRDVSAARARPVRRLALDLLRDDDRGVVGVLVGMLIGSVLLGLSALVIDVGQLYQERAQLQSGADAAALAVAKLCIDSTCTASNALSTAQTYANDNAADGAAGVGTICGYADSLTACGTSSGAMTACPSPPASGTNYVDVNTSTKTSGGATVIAPIFAQELTGNSSYSGTSVQACAQVQWGSGGGSGGSTYSGIFTAFAVPACQWDKQSSAGYISSTASYPSSSYDMKLTLSYGGKAGCSTEASGSDGPGTFGWITETGGCTENPPLATTYSVHTSTTSANCNTPLYDDAQNKSVIYIPVYTSVTGSGSSAVYNAKGAAAFVVTGYNVPGSGQFASWSDSLNSANKCTGTSYCIDGYFVSEPGTLSASGGVTSMKITG